MKKYLFLIILVTYVLAAGCKRNDNTNTTEAGTSGRIPVIDLTADYPVKTLDIHDIADIEYIQLELNDSSLLSTPILTMTDDYIVTFNKQRDIVIFNRDGSHSHTFNHLGEAPFEYRTISRILVDPDIHDIFVTAHSSDIIQQYDFQGNHIRTIKLPEQYRHGQEFFIKDKKTLLGIDRKFTSNMEERERHGVNHQPFYCIDLATESITELPINMVDPTSDGLSWYVDNNVYGISLWASPLTTIGDTLIVADAMEDNISIFTGDSLKPIIAKRNKVSEKGNPYLTTIDGMNDRYILLHTIEKAIDIKSNSIPDPVQYLYDRQSGEWNRILLTNSDIDNDDIPDYYYGRLSGSNHALPKGYMAQVIMAEQLCNLRDEGRLHGTLEEFRKKIDIEDNPIILLARLKE